MKNMKTGTADLPLHYGHCPRWLFKRMAKLSGAIAEAIVLEFGRDEFLKRLSDPFFFQSLGCVVGFDWHSSGLTTTLCGALKEGIKPEDMGIAILGGKGKMSRMVLGEIERIGDIFSISTKNIERLKYSSKMSAKIDNVVLQDGYQLYHHCFILTEDCKWSVIQQGLNIQNNYARRYHWLSEKVKSFVIEPHSAICCDKKDRVLNMIAEESEDCRKCSVDIIKERPEFIFRAFMNGQSVLKDFSCNKRLKMGKIHEIPEMDKRNVETLKRVYEIQPDDYEELVSINGVGYKIIRALALISDLIYGEKPSWKDPVKFSFAHGGKDRIPYPVDRENYDRSIEVLKTAIENAKLGKRDKLNALKDLKGFI